MISTLAWKEYREHQTVWAALAALAILLIVSMTQVLAANGVAGAPEAQLQMIALAALILAETYGLICGAMMVAGEKEAKTQTFLDTLPAGRIRVWMTKVLIGALFTLAQALVVTGVLVAEGLTEVKALPAGWQLALPLIALEAFGYGLFGSVIGRSVLGAFGWALIPVTISWLIGGEVYWPPTVFVIAARLTLLLLLLGLAGLVYCYPDLRRGLAGSGDFPVRTALPGQQGRGPDEDPAVPRRVRRGRASSSSEIWRVLIWLALRQGWARFVLLAGAGFVIGMMLPNGALATWPIATLLVGVAFGSGMFNGEQAGESYRFLGDQRLPPGSVWLAKTITWFSMAAVVIGTIILGALKHSTPMRPAMWRQVSNLPHIVGGYPGQALLSSSLLLESVPKDVFLLLWPVYGFSIGQLLGLVSRKSAVALVLSLLVSVPAVGIWIPSLVAGGLKLWQVLPLAGLLLLSTRLGVWAWAGDQLKNSRSASGLIACVVLAGLWLAGNLVYRAVEVPELGEPFNVAAFIASQPTPEQNGAAARIHHAVREFVPLEQAAQERLERIDEVLLLRPEGPALMVNGLPVEAGPPTPLESRRPSLDELIARTLEKGWPDDDAELASWWLDQLCQPGWIKDLREAAALPLGVLEDPRQSASIQSDVCFRAARVLAARALQIQGHGNHALALDHLLWALALSRNLRHQSVAAYYQEGQLVEAAALQALERWLDRLGTQPDLLQRALGELNRHEDETPLATDPIKAEYTTFLKRLDDPVHWYYSVTGYAGTGELERDLIALALQTPWERERAGRILHAFTSSRLKEAETPYWQLPLQARAWDRNSVPAGEAILACFVPDGKNTSFTSAQWERLLADSRLLLRLFALSSRPQHQAQAFALSRVRGARLKLALTLYQVHEGKPAPSLAHLVPRYLDELPLDPFSGRPYHYRVSTGERIDWRQGISDDRPPGTDIPAGQGILWSVGPEAFGNIGMRDTPSAPTAADQVFIVPSWLK